MESEQQAQGTPERWVHAARGIKGAEGPPGLSVDRSLGQDLEMGYHAQAILQRRVTRADTRSIKVRLCVLMCGRREECMLSWECIVRIAKLIKATPFGGKEFASCQFEEHLFAKQRAWDDMYAEYIQTKLDLKARWQATPDMKLWPGADGFDSSFQLYHSDPVTFAEADDHGERAVDSSVEQEADRYHGYAFLTSEKLTGAIDGPRGVRWYLHQLFSATGARPHGDHLPPVLTCMVKGLPEDTIREYQNPFDTPSYAYGGDDDHCHCFCYLDGLFAVDWDVDYLSPERSGFSKQAVAVEKVCAVCKVPPRLLSYENHNCPVLPYYDRVVAGPVAIQPQPEVTEWAGKIGGKSRLEYIQGLADPTVNFAPAVGSCGLEVIHILRDYEQKLAQHQIDPGDVRIIMFFNN